jgi:hypothetical protein
MSFPKREFALDKERRGSILNGNMLMRRTLSLTRVRSQPRRANMRLDKPHISESPGWVLLWTVGSESRSLHDATIYEEKSKCNI